MPHSGREFEGTFLGIVKALAPARVLDIGVGAGKIGRLVKQVVPTATMHGIEAEPSYAGQFEIEWKLYEKVDVGEAVKVSCRLAESRFDLVVFGDVLEHMWKHEALSLLQFWACRSSYVVAIWPVGYPQDAAGGVQSEIHRSEITLSDLAGEGLKVVRFHMHERPAAGQSKCIAVIRGRMAKRDSQVGVAY